MAKVSLRAYNREIEANIDRGHLDEAIAHCQHILKTFPKHLETYRLLGKSYLEAKHYNEAVDIFSRVLVAEPSDFVSQVGMSIIRDEQNKLDDAIWHMERAFETQPSNAAIQGELQRLYGRRDGTQPPRIRMTRGALAHMYMQGELYPQAISETKSVLEEDQGRTDMQALLAKAYFKSGHKNDAADTASMVLKRYPFCLDANRVLTEILGIDRPESAETYRRRVYELDPYAAQVDGSVFQSNDVNDAAVTLERLDWNGQPAGMPSNWGTTGAISLESGSADEQPDWLKNALPETTSAPPSALAFDSDKGDSPAQPADDIPDFLREAGWGESTGTFDESKASAMFDDEPTAEAQPLEQADMPDWVKAMAPSETSEPADEEEIPDWINKIGTGELPIPSVVSDESQTEDSPDWLKQEGETSTSEKESSEGEEDWLMNLGQDENEQPASDGQLDSILNESEAPAPEMETSDDQLDWLKNLGQEEESEPTPENQPDWLNQLGGEEEDSSTSQPVSETDFLNSLKSDEPEQAEPATASTEERSAMPDDTGNLGMGEQEQDDSFAWLENLAAKQGATEGLLTKPEERREDEPDWVKQAKGLAQSEGQQPAAQEQQEEQAASETTAQPELSAPSPAGNVEELGKSDEERDDSFAWLENLAAKQGATEGLLTKPEERREDEPDWVKQAKSSKTSQPSVQQTPEQVQEPVATESESLSETTEMSQEDIEMMKHAREVGEQFYDESIDMPKQDAEESVKAEEAGADVSSWLAGLDEEQSMEQVESESTLDTQAWLKTLEEPEEEPAETESALPSDEAVESSEDLPGWLSDLDKEVSESPGVPASDDLPAWMRDDTGELVAEPTKIEPIRSTDWAPEDQKKDEPEETVEAPSPPASEPFAESKPEPAPEVITPEPVAESKPEPVAETPAPPPETKPEPNPEPVKKPAPQKKQEVKPATPPEPYKEPVTRKTTGMLEMPVDPILGSARSELSRSNIPGALETYGKLIKKGRFLEEVIYDLREALYRYPVEVSIWQSLGDAYMRANQLQDALDAYTKAEELLR